MKKKLIGTMALTTLVSSALVMGDLSSVKAAEEEKSRNDYTFYEVYKDMKDYIADKTGERLRVGTLNFNTDIANEGEELSSVIEGAPHEELYNAYIAEYAHRLQLESIESDTPAEVPIGDPMKPIYSKTLGQVKAEIFLEELLDSLKGEEEEGASALASASSSSLSLSDGRAYAKKYYDDFNSGYPQFSNDCTNFVSQILHHSGRNFVNAYSYGGTGVYDNKNAWFVRRNRDGVSFVRSKSWASVSDQYAHLNLTKSTYSSTSKANIISKARAGDVIQFKKKGADRYSHAMWIYAKEDGTLKLSGHTNARLKYDFKKVSSYQKFRIVSMNMK